MSCSRLFGLLLFIVNLLYKFSFNYDWSCKYHKQKIEQTCHCLRNPKGVVLFQKLIDSSINPSNALKNQNKIQIQNRPVSFWKSCSLKTN